MAFSTSTHVAALLPTPHHRRLAAILHENDDEHDGPPRRTLRSHERRRGRVQRRGRRALPLLLSVATMAMVVRGVAGVKLEDSQRYKDLIKATSKSFSIYNQGLSGTIPTGKEVWPLAVVCLPAHLLVWAVCAL